MQGEGCSPSAFPVWLCTPNAHTWAAAPIPPAAVPSAVLGTELWGSRTAPRMLSPTALALLLKDVVSSSAGSTGSSHPHIAYHCGARAKLRHEHHQPQAYRVSLHLIKEDESSSDGLYFVVVESEARSYLNYSFLSSSKYICPVLTIIGCREPRVHLFCVFFPFCYCKTADTARAPSTLLSTVQAVWMSSPQPHLSSVGQNCLFSCPYYP